MVLSPRIIEEEVNEKSLLGKIISSSQKMPTLPPRKWKLIFFCKQALIIGQSHLSFISQLVPKTSL